MVEETGVVMKTGDITATVHVQKRGACESCSVTGVCEPTGEEGMEIEALNPINAKKGQTVRMSIKPKAYIKGTMLVFGLPLILFITGVIAGKNIGEAYLKNINSDIVSGVTGFLAFSIGFLIAKSWTKKAETKKEYQPVIEAILE